MKLCFSNVQTLSGEETMSFRSLNFKLNGQGKILTKKPGVTMWKGRCMRLMLVLCLADRLLDLSTNDNPKLLGTGNLLFLLLGFKKIISYRHIPSRVP